MTDSKCRYNRPLGFPSRPRLSARVLLAVCGLVVASVCSSCGRTQVSPAASATPETQNPQSASGTADNAVVTVPERMRGKWLLRETDQGADRERVLVGQLARGGPLESVYLTISSLTATLEADGQKTELALRLRPEGSGLAFEATEAGDQAAHDKSLRGHVDTEGERLLVRLEDAAPVSCLVFERQDARPTTVFLVHGTYDATSDWVNEIPDAATFASELREALGRQSTKIEPFLWRTSIHHEARMQAAQDLARCLDDPRFADDRIILIGHSHGGNVCLAACGKCTRSIDLVLCLATPHLHLVTQDSNKGPVALPVYCSPQSFRNIRRIVTVSAMRDPVLNTSEHAPLGPWADVRKGLDEPTAVSETYEWRRTLNHPRLVDDGGAVQEVIEDVLGEKLSGNLIMSPTLSVTPSAIEVACEATDLRAHGMIHSCRMGQVLGAVIRDDFSEPALQYLSNLVLPADADVGEATSLAAHGEWWGSHNAGMRHSGWVLRSLTVESRATLRRNGKKWDLDNSWPDLFVRAHQAGAQIGETASVLDRQRVTWEPGFHVRDAAPAQIMVWDKDLVEHDHMGGFSIQGTPEQAPGTSYEADEFQAELRWGAGHY